MQTSLSIGIPVYNQAGTIRETIDSVLDQLQPAHEVVVCDNHSTDGTSEIVASYGDRIRVVSPPTHLGMMANWNWCVSCMGGTWITLISGDDLLRSQFVRDMAAAADANRRAVLVRGDWEFIDGLSRVTRVQHQRSVRGRTKPPRTFVEQIEGPKTSFAAFAVRKSAFDEIGGFDENFHLFGDWDLWLRLSGLGEFVRVKHVVSAYRSTERPTLNAFRIALRIADEARIACTIIKQCDQIGLPLTDIKPLLQRRTQVLLNYLYSQNYVLLSDKDQDNLSFLSKTAGMESLVVGWLRSPAPMRAIGWCRSIRNIFRRFV